MNRNSRLRPVSRKRAAQQRVYSQLRRQFLEHRQWCESPWACGQRATEVQHRKGREGVRLIDVEWWASGCHDCNMRAETETGVALATGWLVRLDDPRTASEVPIIPIRLEQTA